MDSAVAPLFVLQSIRLYPVAFVLVLSAYCYLFTSLNIDMHISLVCHISLVLSICLLRKLHVNCSAYQISLPLCVLGCCMLTSPS
jgi:hypothetical protein